VSEKLPDATYLRALAKWMMRHGIGSQTDHERLVEIGDGLEWKPIPEAPKDGTQIVLLVNGKATAGWWRYDGWNDGWCLLGSSFVTSHRASHWKPLPAPPVGTGEA
jgi:hypothetical protein